MSPGVGFDHCSNVHFFPIFSLMASEIRILQHLWYDTVIQEEIVVGELERGILRYSILNRLFIEFLSCGYNAILFTKGVSNDPESGNSFLSQLVQWRWRDLFHSQIDKDQATPSHLNTVFVAGDYLLRPRRFLFMVMSSSMIEVHILHVGYDKTTLKTTKQRDRSPTTVYTPEI